MRHRIKVSDAEWVKASDSGARIYCERCGGELRLGLPVLLSVWLAAVKEFLRIHSRCEKL